MLIELLAGILVGYGLSMVMLAAPLNNKFFNLPGLDKWDRSMVALGSLAVIVGLLILIARI
jgi:hypothetical protein